MSEPVDTPIGAVFDSSHIATLIAGVLGSGVSTSLPERSVSVPVDEGMTPASLDDTCGDDTAFTGAHVLRGLSGSGRPVDVAERLMLWDERRAQRLEEARRSAEAERLKREEISVSSPVSARGLQRRVYHTTHAIRLPEATAEVEPPHRAPYRLYSRSATTDSA